MGCKILNYKENKPSVIIKNGCDPLEFNVAPVVLDKPYFFALCKWRRHIKMYYLHAALLLIVVDPMPCNLFSITNCVIC